MSPRTRRREVLQRVLFTPTSDTSVIDGASVDVGSVREHLASALFDVDPRQVRWRMRPWAHGIASQAVPAAGVVGGTWDRLVTTYRPHPVVARCVLSRHVQGQPAGAGYRPPLRLSDLDRARRRRYVTPQDRSERRASVEALVEAVVATGFRPQPGIGGRSEDEIGVYVTRTGRLVWGRQGDHRLSAAQLLGVAAVPVIVRGVHRDFVLAARRSHPAGSAIDAVDGALSSIGVALHGGA